MSKCSESSHSFFILRKEMMSNPNITGPVPASYSMSTFEAAEILAMYVAHVPRSASVMAFVVYRLAMNAEPSFPIGHIIEGLMDREDPIDREAARIHLTSKIEPGTTGLWFADGDPVEDLIQFGRSLRQFAPMSDHSYAEDLIEELERINHKEYADKR